MWCFKCPAASAPVPTEGLLQGMHPDPVVSQAPQQQAFRNLVQSDLREYVSQEEVAEEPLTVVDQYGGMLWNVRHQYATSWYLEGAVFNEHDQTYVVVSTAESNVAGRMEVGFPYNHLDVWSQPGTWVSSSNPLFVFGTREGTVLDFFEDRMASVAWSGFQSMEEVLQHLGIEYARFICGFSLQYQGLTEQYCALDWYYQDAALREDDRDLWYHGLILDQWDPSYWYKSTIIRNDLPLYRGWCGHALGQTARYDSSDR